MDFVLQARLENNLVKLIPLKADEFEILYSIASDPLIWEQHPNKDRYKREVFEVFFKGAIESQGAYTIYNAKKGKPIGCTRFYDYNALAKRVCIGYTFIARDHWGGEYNRAAKLLMLNHAFQFVDTVEFHVGAANIRSQKAMEKLGAIKVEEKEMSYYGEGKKLNFIYHITRPVWEKLKGKN